MTLTLYQEDYAICQLSSDSKVPAWAFEGRFYSISKTDDELSVVCGAAFVPNAIKAEKGWRTFKLHGPFAFDEVGVIASLTVPLAQANLGVFVVSTFDTDYLLIKAAQLTSVLEVLKTEQHKILEA